MRQVLTPLRLFSILLVLAALVAGCSGEDSADSFEQDVVAARDTADSALANIRRPESAQDLILRLRTAGDDLATASGTVAASEAPGDLADEKRRLVGALSNMSKELDAAANTIELVQTGPAGEQGQVQSLIFDTWDTVNAALAALRTEGIDVQPLRRHGGAEDEGES
jgi:hypothetical protein